MRVKQIFNILLLLLIEKSLSHSTIPQQVQSTSLNSQTSSDSTSEDQNSTQTFSSDSSTKSSTYVSSMFSYLNPFKKSNIETSTESQTQAEKLTSTSWLSETSLFDKITETLRMIQNTTVDEVLNLNSFDSSTSEMTSSDPEITTSSFTTSDETFTKDFDQIEQICNKCVKNCYKNNFCASDLTSSEDDHSTTEMDIKLSTTKDFGSSLSEESTTISSSQSSDFSTSTDDILTTTSEPAKSSFQQSCLQEFVKVTTDYHELKVKYNLIVHKLSLEKRRRKEAENNLKIVQTLTEEIKIKSEETQICHQKLENSTINFNFLANLIDTERLKVGLAQKIHEFDLTDEIKTSNSTTMKFLIFELETEDSQVTLVSNQNLVTLPSRLVEIAPSLSEFSASNCGIEFIVKSSFEELENLKVLNFSRNFISKIEDKIFSELKSLEILDFSFNSIEKLEIFSFYGLEELSELNLSSNKISSLPSAIFGNLIKLKILNLSQNLINELKIEIFPSKISIIEFYVDNNLLSLIDSNLIIGLENATIVDMSSNLCIDAKFPEKSLLELGINLTKNCSNLGESEDENFDEF